MVARVGYEGTTRQITIRLLAKLREEELLAVTVVEGRDPSQTFRIAGVMKALVKNKYTGSIYPEHPKALDADRDRLAPGGRLPGYPGGGGYTGITFSVAYARAMMQAALESA